LVQQYTFPPIFMQKFEKSTPGLLWVNKTVYTVGKRLLASKI